MARDYKHSKRRSGSSGLSSWLSMAIGLGLGLSVAAAVYLYDRRPNAHPLASEAPMASERPSKQESPPAAHSEEPDTNYEFYDMLPKAEVVVPDNNKSGSTENPNPKIEKPGAYILQAGSFRQYADADRVRALLALQGIESKVQKITVDRDTWHRVRIGPINNLQALEETRRKLREAQIDAMVIRIGG